MPTDPCTSVRGAASSTAHELADRSETTSVFYSASATLLKIYRQLAGDQREVFANADECLDFLAQYKLNSFMLTTSDGTNVGVAVCPVAALSAFDHAMSLIRQSTTTATQTPASCSLMASTVRSRCE